MAACCSDRYTENRGEQICIESLPSVEASGVFSAVLLHLHAWTYGGQVGLHDSVCAEAYSVCCQGYQQGENYSSVTQTE